MWTWSDPEEEAFRKLKTSLTSAPILRQAEPRAPYILRIDASAYAIGAILLQGRDEHPVEYASRLLLPAERNYSTTEREALAIVWAVQKFRGYIEEASMVVITDHQPLKWLTSLKSPSGPLARWSVQLQPYNLENDYDLGRANVVADSLSRPPGPPEPDPIPVGLVSLNLPQMEAEQLRA